MLQADDLYEICRAGPRVFTLHPDLRRANFYFQQLRGLALVRQMVLRGDIVAGRDEVIVVGAGVAGMTIAAALLTAGLTVTLIEREVPLKVYRTAFHRELHPNIIAWPFQPPRGVTNLPFLNWSCGPAPAVCAQLLEQWEQDFKKSVTSVSDTVTGIEERGDGVTVNCSKKSYIADCVVLAVGFKGERTLPTAPIRGPKYWTTPSFEEDETPGAPPRQIVVTGSGDGGLIDAAYQVFGVNTVAASRALAYSLDAKVHKDRVKHAETKAQQLADAGKIDEAHDSLEIFYSKLRLDDEDENMLKRFARLERFRSRLYFKEKTAYSPTVAPINKVLVSHLCNVVAPALTMQMATVDAVDTAGTKILATPPPPAASEAVDKEFLVVRHGADHAAWDLLSVAHKAKLKAAAPSKLNDFIEDSYDEDFYLHAPKVPLAPSPKHNALLFEERAYRWVQAMIRQVTGSDRNHEVKRDLPSRTWTVDPGPYEHLMRGLFPLKFGRLTVVLTSPSYAVFDAV